MQSRAIACEEEVFKPLDAGGRSARGLNRLPEHDGQCEWKGLFSCDGKKTQAKNLSWTVVNLPQKDH